MSALTTIKQRLSALKPKENNKRHFFGSTERIARTLDNINLYTEDDIEQHFGQWIATNGRYADDNQTLWRDFLGEPYYTRAERGHILRQAMRAHRIAKGLPPEGIHPYKKGHPNE